METEHPIPNTQSYTRKRKLLLTFIIIILLVLAGFYLVMRSNLNWFEREDGVQTPEAQLIFLKRTSKASFTLPTIVNEEETRFVVMPERVRALFPPNHKVFWVHKITFADGSNGFRVEYRLDTQVLNEYRDFLDRWYAQGPYEINASSRAEDAAFSVLQNQFYHVVAEFLQPSDTSMLAKLIVVLK